MTPQDFALRALTVPFVEKGRDWSGLDCWGLVRLFYLEVLGVELPSYHDRYQSTRERYLLRRVIRGERDAQWREVPENLVRTGDALTAFQLGAECHIGIVIDPMRREFIHIEARGGTLTERWTEAPWRGDTYDNIDGFFRYAGAV